MTDAPIFLLLVEDEPAHAELIRRAFEDRGDSVRLKIVLTVEEARQVLAESSTPPALIISDWRLPDGEGLDLLRLADGEKLLLPLVLMTSYGNERVAVDAMRAGALDYVVKSELTLADMPHIVDRALRQWNTLQDHERIQSALHESGSLLHTVVNNIPIFLVAINQAGTVTMAEGKGLARLHLKPEDLLGQSAQAKLALLSPAPELLRQALQGESSSRLIQLGKTTLESWFSPMLDQNGSVVGAVCLATDISQRLRAEMQLQDAHQALMEAYDATIEGWAHALELRERETAGHSRRVVDLTLDLACRMGLDCDTETVANLRRGALLHDIGKMAIPDHILLKPDVLTEDEWRIMRQHPLYSYRLLSGISYLQSALDIPRYHHERWNGSGYPEGLKNKAIPLAARIFSVVDVFDALTSNRPYRPAWTEQAARDYLFQQAGLLFDSSVVEAFLGVPLLHGSAAAD